MTNMKCQAEPKASDDNYIQTNHTHGSRLNYRRKNSLTSLFPGHPPLCDYLWRNRNPRWICCTKCFNKRWCQVRNIIQMWTGNWTTPSSNSTDITLLLRCYVKKHQMWRILSKERYNILFHVSCILFNVLVCTVRRLLVVEGNWMRFFYWRLKIRHRWRYMRGSGLLSSTDGSFTICFPITLPSIRRLLTSLKIWPAGWNTSSAGRIVTDPSRIRWLAYNSY